MFMCIGQEALYCRWLSVLLTACDVMIAVVGFMSSDGNRMAGRVEIGV